MTSEEVKAKGIGSFWVLMIVVPLIVFGCALVVKWTNDSQDRQQAAYRRDQDRRQAQARRALEAKFQEALRISNRQNAYSINKSVCVLRKISQQQVDRLELTKPDGYKAAEGFWQDIVDNQIPVPPSFDCKTLPKKPPKLEKP